MNPDDIIRYQDYDPKTRTYVITGPVFEEPTKRTTDDDMFAPILEMFKKRDAGRRSANNIIKFPNKNRYT